MSPADNPTGKEYAGVDENGSFVLGYAKEAVGQDFIDANGNGSTTDYIIRASAIFQAAPPTEIKASKFILGEGNQPTCADSPVAEDDTYTFRLQVENKTTGNETKLIIYEVLPQVGDQNYVVPGQTYPARNSQFAGVLNGPVTGARSENIRFNTVRSRTRPGIRLTGLRLAAAAGRRQSPIGRRLRRFGLNLTPARWSVRWKFIISTCR